MSADHSKKVETAFATYLQGLSTWPATLASITAGENNTDMTGQNIVCWVDGNSQPEDPPLSGNRRHECFIRLRTPVVRDDPNGAAYAGHLAAEQAIENAVTVTGLELLLTAAVANFTCFGIVEHTAFSQQTDTDWESGYMMTIYSCPSSFPN